MQLLSSYVPGLEMIPLPGPVRYGTVSGGDRWVVHGSWISWMDPWMDWMDGWMEVAAYIRTYIVCRTMTHVLYAIFYARDRKSGRHTHQVGKGKEERKKGRNETCDLKSSKQRTIESPVINDVMHRSRTFLDDWSWAGHRTYVCTSCIPIHTYILCTYVHTIHDNIEALYLFPMISVVRSQ